MNEPDPIERAENELTWSKDRGLSASVIPVRDLEALLDLARIGEQCTLDHVPTQGE